MLKSILNNKVIKKIAIIGVIFVLVLLLLDLLIIPWWVDKAEVEVPKVIGMNQDEAIKQLENTDLNPIISDTAFNQNYPKGTIVLQKPDPGSIVKVGRRVYLFVSGGEPTVIVPILKGKSLRDAKFALERIGLLLGEVEYLPSNNPKNMIFDQEYVEGTPLKKGQSVKVYVSSGIESGNIIVPDLIGKSLMEASKILADSSLKVGKITYQISFTLLPNTVIDQYPSKDSKLNAGDPVDLFVTKAAEENIQKEIEE